jgi:gliding motility-associated-like protein
VADTIFELKSPSFLTVSIGSDTTIRLGDTLYIAANFNVPFSEVDTLIWSTNLKPTCPTCPYGNVSPKRSTRYIVRAISKDGCEATAYKVVTIDETLPVYIPTAFSPNGDMNNDYFNLFADKTVLKINYLRIYDRWGNAVYNGENLQPNDDTKGWDGTYRGQAMDSAVFVFQAEILLKNGSTRMVNGEVMLVR